MRLIVVSNRLPISVAFENNKIKITDSAGGVASGIAAFLEAFKKNNPDAEYLWVGWPGEAVPEDRLAELREGLMQKCLFPVFLDKEQVEKFYYGFCNSTIWPLFHSFISYVSYKPEHWAAYKEVNELFAKKISAIAKPGDVVWVHDYHFMLLPKILREKISEKIPIGFFLHIPFPSFEIFRLFPDKWRRSLLNGVLGADLAGFHTYDYTQYFADSVQRILGYERTIDNIVLNSRVVAVDTFPIGIDFNKFYEGAVSRETEKERQKLKKNTQDKKMILSIDRLDYTKGINKRLLAYELFLENNSRYAGKIVLVLTVIPSRAEVGQYREMKKEIDELVGKINGRFGSINWTPILYQYKHLNFAELSALYCESHVALITPLRDGMNMIAKEYIASRRDQTGVLVLSEMAGAASELGEAIIINPNHIEEIAAALKEALEMPVQRQKEYNRLMQARLRRYDVVRWGNDNIKELKNFKEKQAAERQNKFLNTGARSRLFKDFARAGRRLLVLDYDGTLAPFAKYPPLARPSEEVLKILKQVSDLPDTAVAVISGRDRATMEKWFKSVNIGISAEHGIWLKLKGERWKSKKNLRQDWKESVMPVMRTFVDRVPGSFLEEKEFSLVWHYRTANPELANLRAKELISNLLGMSANMNVQVLPGNKIVEIRTAGVNKGSVVLDLLGRQKYDFILGIGDDTTDEDLFTALPETAYTIKVRAGQTAARYIVDSPGDVLALLRDLAAKAGRGG